MQGNVMGNTINCDNGLIVTASIAVIKLRYIIVSCYTYRAFYNPPARQLFDKRISYHS